MVTLLCDRAAFSCDLSKINLSCCHFHCVLRFGLSDFQEKKSIRPTFSAERIFGGILLAMCSSDFICFYDWVDCRLIRRIDVTVKVGQLLFSLVEILNVCVTINLSILCTCRTFTGLIAVI